MNIITIPSGPLNANAYVVYKEDGGDCVVIDPASSGKVGMELSKHQLHCTHILLTHGHFDHIMGVADLRYREKSICCIHRYDAHALDISDSSVNLCHMSGAMVKRCPVDKFLKDGEVISAAGFDFLVIHTPGHSRGSVCFVVESEKVIFTGDTLFRLSVGRTDLAGGNAEDLYRSITRELFTLPGDYRVLPGHMRETTLDFERKHNPFILSGGRL